jgi:hypothetical protein
LSLIATLVGCAAADDTASVAASRTATLVNQRVRPAIGRGCIMVNLA